jgi:hypothetical protein
VRVPVERDVPEHEQHEPLPAPAVMPRKLEAPDARFIADIAMAVRAGARVETAALWLGCSRKQWKRWRQRTGGIYDELRSAVAAATAHAQIKLEAALAARSPGQALKQLRRVRARDDDPEPPSRSYQQHGLHTLKKALPHLVERVADESIPSDALTPVESAAREFRADVLADLGGREHVTATKLALLNACVGTWIVLSSLDHYVFELAGSGGLVNRRTRVAFGVVTDRQRVADTLVRQLLALGLEKRSPPPMDLTRYVEEKYGQNADADVTPAEAKETE